MVEEFDDWLEERSGRTFEEEVPERDKKAPLTRQVRAFTTIRQLLGYDAPNSGSNGPDEESSLGAEEAELLQRYEAGEISEEELLGLA